MPALSLLVKTTARCQGCWSRTCDRTSVVAARHCTSPSLSSLPLFHEQAFVARLRPYGVGDVLSHKPSLEIYIIQHQLKLKWFIFPLFDLKISILLLIIAFDLYRLLFAHDKGRRKVTAVKDCNFIYHLLSCHVQDWTVECELKYCFFVFLFFFE